MAMSFSLQRSVNSLIGSYTQVEMVNTLSDLSTIIDESEFEQFDTNFQVQDKLDTSTEQQCEVLRQGFQGVQSKIETIASNIEFLQQNCEAITKQLEEARTKTSALMSQTTTLAQEKKAVERTGTLAADFLKRFELSEEHIHIIQDPNNLGPSFHATLAHISQLRQDCRDLLEQYHHRVGLDIMESLGTYSERGYDKLYQYVQQQSRDLEDVPDSNGSFFVAFRLLKHMPVYYEHCRRELGQCRRLLMIRRFLSALSRGGPNGNPRPIDIYAHDAVRYIGDMLAWCHQAIASECDFFATLSAQEEDDNDGTTMKLLSQVFEGVARPFRLRVEQTTMTQTAPSVLLQLANLLGFYHKTVLTYLSPDCVFVETLSSLSELNNSTFLQSLSEQGKRIIQTPPRAMHDMTPPKAIKDVLTQFEDILEHLESTLLESKEVVFSLERVLPLIINPLVESTKISPGLDESEKLVYGINTITFILRVLHRFPNVIGCVSKMETLKYEKQTLMEQLIPLQTNILLKSCELQEIFPVINDFISIINSNEEGKEPENLSLRFPPASLSKPLHMFYEIAFSFGSFVSIPQCDHIIEQLDLRYVQHQVAVSLSKKYKDIYTVISHPKSGYQSTSTSLLTHTSKQIDLLLDV